MAEWLGRTADPGRVHTEGRMVRAAIEDAREQVAGLVGALPREVVFTSGATEAINAAVFGATGPIACAAVEHSAVREASARAGALKPLDVDRTGRITWTPVEAGFVQCQWGNQEVGTLQPVAEVVAWCRAHEVRVHVDAAQAAGRVPLDLRALDADLVSISGHKFGGPPGTGALIVRRGLRLPPLLVGGEQERARRAGMENVPAIVGLGVAADHVALETEARTARAQTDALLRAALAVPGVVAYSPDDRLPHIVCVGVEGVEAEAVLLGLDQAGVAAHSGSACSSESLEPSPVLAAMGVEAERSLRLSVGWNTTDQDIAVFTRVFPEVVARLRSLRGG